MKTTPLLYSAFLAVTPILAVMLAGCQPRAAQDGPLSVPDHDSVSVIAGHSNVQTPDHAQWTWSILGERNWTQPAAKETRLTLSDSYPLNDVKRQHGCNTWNCDLTLERDTATKSIGKWTLKLHGSNGQTAESSGTVPLKNDDLNATVSSVQDRDTTMALPASLTLALLGDKDITVAISK